MILLEKFQQGKTHQEIDEEKIALPACPCV